MGTGATIAATLTIAPPPSGPALGRAIARGLTTTLCLRGAPPQHLTTRALLAMTHGPLPRPMTRGRLLTTTLLAPQRPQHTSRRGLPTLPNGATTLHLLEMRRRLEPLTLLPAETTASGRGRGSAFPRLARARLPTPTQRTSELTAENGA